MKLRGRRTVTTNGLNFITRWEVGGFTGYLRPYNDGSGYATIGIGHLLHKSVVTTDDVAHYAAYRGLDGKAKPHAFDQADALGLLASDLAWVERDILTYIRPPLGPDHFDALADLIFNCGPAPLTGTVGALYNEQHFAEAAQAMLAWSHAGGELVPGLLARREAEQQLILRGAY